MQANQHHIFALCGGGPLVNHFFVAACDVMFHKALQMAPAAQEFFNMDVCDYLKSGFNKQECHQTSCASFTAVSCPIKNFNFRTFLPIIGDVLWSCVSWQFGVIIAMAYHRWSWWYFANRIDLHYLGWTKWDDSVAMKLVHYQPQNEDARTSFFKSFLSTLRVVSMSPRQALEFTTSLSTHHLVISHFYYLLFAIKNLV